MITKSTDKIRWYNYRKTGEKYWQEIQLTDGQLACLQSCYEISCPHKSRIDCIKARGKNG